MPRRHRSTDGVKPVDGPVPDFVIEVASLPFHPESSKEDRTPNRLKKMAAVKRSVFELKDSSPLSWPGHVMDKLEDPTMSVNSGFGGAWARPSNTG